MENKEINYDYQTFPEHSTLLSMFKIPMTLNEMYRM